MYLRGKLREEESTFGPDSFLEVAFIVPRYIICGENSDNIILHKKGLRNVKIEIRVFLRGI